MSKTASFCQELNNSTYQCHLCPHNCKLSPGQHGLCFVRYNNGETISLLSYGRTTGFAIDPIEKKPLNHFFPNSNVLSFGTIGCHLSCKFCQNWHISHCKELSSLQTSASPEEIALLAKQNDCKSVAFTYNDPIPSLEYYLDIASNCRREGIEMVAVTAGYINPEPAKELFAVTDAVNIDLKSFNEHFYKHLTGASLTPILQTLKYVANETDTWLEITNLVIPGENDSDQEIDAMTNWIIDNLGPNIPLSFSAFHPSGKMKNHTRTSTARLLSAREIALKNGINYVYCGNIPSIETATTYCHNCKTKLIERSGYRVRVVNMENSKCRNCHTEIPGRFV